MNANPTFGRTTPVDAGPATPQRLVVKSPTINGFLAALPSPVEVGDLYSSDSGALAYEALVGEDRCEISSILTWSRNLRGRVLDLGAGTGRLTIPLLMRGHEVAAVDLEPAMLALLQEKVNALGAEPAARLTVVVGDMCSVELDGQFDVILIGTTNISLLNAEQRSRLLRRIPALLAKGGRLYLSTLEFDNFAGDDLQEQIFLLPQLAASPLKTPLLVETLDPVEWQREVVIFAFDERVHEYRIHTSRPRIVSLSVITDELLRSGMKVRRSSSVKVGRDRTDFLLECEVDND